MLHMYSNLSLNSYQKTTYAMATASLHIQPWCTNSELQHSCTLLCLQSFHCSIINRSKTDGLCGLYTKNEQLDIQSYIYGRTISEELQE